MAKPPLKENETVELKKSLAELKQGLVSMVAILNKHQAGTLWFGVRNNGVIAGIEALREAIINAFCHRDYYDPDYIQMAIFKDRVEIRNPGKLYGNLTIDDLRKGNVSQRRNPLIADLFRRIEMVEAWDRGMPLILKYAPDVVFREIGNLFIVSFNRPSFLEQEDKGGGATQETTQEKSKAPKETPEKPQRNHKEVILSALKKQPSISIRALSVQCDMSVHSVQHHINKLKELGVIRHVGPTKAGRWEMMEGRLEENDFG
jgi:ATP-dependent DNA helicase RecG